MGGDGERLGAEVGRRLRALRTEQGVSLSELARRSGLGKGTLSELETGRRNPTLETLFALTTALGEPLSAALAPAPDQAPHATGTAVDAWLVERLPGTEVLRLRVRPGAEQRSPAHAAGVTEQLLVVSGRLRLGPEDAPAELDAGQSATYAGDVPHVFAALGGREVRAVLVMRYPTG